MLEESHLGHKSSFLDFFYNTSFVMTSPHVFFFFPLSLSNNMKQLLNLGSSVIPAASLKQMWSGRSLRGASQTIVGISHAFVTEQQKSFEAFNCFNLTWCVLICLHDKKANYTYAGAVLRFTWKCPQNTIPC